MSKVCSNPSKNVKFSFSCELRSVRAFVNHTGRPSGWKQQKTSVWIQSWRMLSFYECCITVSLFIWADSQKSHAWQTADVLNAQRGVCGELSVSKRILINGCRFRFFLFVSDSTRVNAPEAPRGPVNPALLFNGSRFHNQYQNIPRSLLIIIRLTVGSERLNLLQK